MRLGEDFDETFDQRVVVSSQHHSRMAFLGSARTTFIEPEMFVRARISCGTLRPSQKGNSAV
jgi:hypothetical protein